MWKRPLLIRLTKFNFLDFGWLSLPCPNRWALVLLIFIIIFIRSSILNLNNSLDISSSLVHTDTVSHFVILSHHLFLNTNDAGKYEHFGYLSFDSSNCHQFSVLGLLCIVVHHSMYVIQVLFSAFDQCRVGIFEIFKELMMKSFIKNKESCLLAIEGWHHIALLFMNLMTYSKNLRMYSNTDSILRRDLRYVWNFSIFKMST